MRAFEDSLLYTRFSVPLGTVCSMSTVLVIYLQLGILSIVEIYLQFGDCSAESSNRLKLEC
jgi:hypothetical protein